LVEVAVLVYGTPFTAATLEGFENAAGKNINAAFAAVAQIPGAIYDGGQSGPHGQYHSYLVARGVASSFEKKVVRLYSQIPGLRVHIGIPVGATLGQFLDSPEQRLQAGWSDDVQEYLDEGDPDGAAWESMEEGDWNTFAQLARRGDVDVNMAWDVLADGDGEHGNFNEAALALVLSLGADLGQGIEAAVESFRAPHATRLLDFLLRRGADADEALRHVESKLRTRRLSFGRGDKAKLRKMRQRVRAFKSNPQGGDFGGGARGTRGGTAARSLKRAVVAAERRLGTKNIRWRRAVNDAIRKRCSQDNFPAPPTGLRHEML
jgi:hypothetical protein